MKHLKLLNILIVMLLLTAWAPAPSNLAAPAAPVLSGPANGVLIVGYQPEFSWTQPAYDSDSYNLVLSFDKYFKNIAKEIATFSVDDVLNNGLIRYTPAEDLPSNSVIYWRVQAVTAAGNSSWSAVRSVKTAPYPISGVVGPTGGVNALTLRPTLQWNTSEDGDGVVRTNKFNVQVIKKTGGALAKAATVTDADDVAAYLFTTDLLRNTEYQWRVRADGLYADSAWTGYHDFVTPNPPSVPVLVAPANGFVIPDGSEPTFDWKDSTTTSTNPFTYTLELSTSAKFDTLYGSPVTGIEVSQFTYGHTLLTGTYFWRVKAVDSEGAASNYSLVRSVKTWPSLTVLVQDYLTKAPIADVSLIITGVQGTVLTNASGLYTIPVLPAGSKSVTATKADYLTKKASVSVPAGVAKQLVIEMVHVPMYVKLYWTNPGQNLDLHLWIPEEYNDPVNDVVGHVMADNKGSIIKKPFAKLDKDVLKGSATAVETVTIKDRYPGKYVIGVYNFYKTSMFSSGAKVRVYMGAELMQELLVSATETDTRRWWHVADITTGGVLDPLNQMVGTSPGPFDPDGGTFAIPTE